MSLNCDVLIASGAIHQGAIYGVYKSVSQALSPVKIDGPWNPIWALDCKRKDFTATVISFMG